MKDLRNPKFWADICALFVPLSMIILWIVGIYKCWSISEIGTIIASISGPFAGLAGFLYIYVSFQLQSETLFVQKEQFFESTFYGMIEFFRSNISFSKLKSASDDVFFNLEEIEFDQSQDLTGQLIKKKKEEYELNKIGKNEYKNAISRISDESRQIINYSIRFLIQILNFSREKISEPNHHLNSILRVISKREAAAIFYFYSSYLENYSLEEQRLLFLFFQKIDLTSLNHPHHIKWNRDPKTREV